jgi:hypothetical protein
LTEQESSSCNPRQTLFVAVSGVITVCRRPGQIGIGDNTEIVPMPGVIINQGEIALEVNGETKQKSNV